MTNLTAPMPSSATPFLKDGLINEPWYRFLFQLQLRGGGAGQMPDINALQAQADYNTAHVDYQSVVQQDPMAQAAMRGVDELYAAAVPDFSAQINGIISRLNDIDDRQLELKSVADLRNAVQELQDAALDRGIPDLRNAVAELQNAVLDRPTDTFGRPAIASRFVTYTASATANNGAATTIITLPNQFPSVYLITANIGQTNDTTNYNAFGVVITDGSAARLANVSNGALQTITLSGLNVQSTQGSGGTQIINMTATRIA